MWRAAYAAGKTDGNPMPEKARRGYTVKAGKYATSKARGIARRADQKGSEVSPGFPPILPPYNPENRGKRSEPNKRNMIKAKIDVETKGTGQRERKRRIMATTPASRISLGGAMERRGWRGSKRRAKRTAHQTAHTFPLAKWGWGIPSFAGRAESVKKIPYARATPMDVWYWKLAG